MPLSSFVSEIWSVEVCQKVFCYSVLSAHYCLTACYQAMRINPDETSGFSAGHSRTYGHESTSLHFLPRFGVRPERDMKLTPWGRWAYPYNRTESVPACVAMLSSLPGFELRTSLWRALISTWHACALTTRLSEHMLHIRSEVPYILQTSSSMVKKGCLALG